MGWANNNNDDDDVRENGKLEGYMMESSVRMVSQVN